MNKDELNGIGMYRRIDKVLYEDGSTTFLLTDGENFSFEVDLKGGFWFNELPVLKRETVKTVETLREVVDFCKENGFLFETNGYNRLTGEVLMVGGEADMTVDSNLMYDWKTTAAN